MKLDPIKENHLLEAAAILNENPSVVWSRYWVQIPNEKQYQFKEIVRLAYSIATGLALDSTFRSNERNRLYVSETLGFNIVDEIPGSTPFFKKEEIEYFAEYAGKNYRRNDEDAITAGSIITDTIFRKTNIWIDLIKDGWEFEYDNRWQISGKFKNYSWGRIYKRGDRDSKVYFTFGVDAPPKALVYKLDCQQKQYTKSNALSATQVKAFKRIVNGTGARWNEIQAEDLEYYDWESLRELSLEFLGKYEFLYDEAVKAVNEASGVQPLINLSQSLTVMPPPVVAHNTLPIKSYSFRGVVIDYDAEQKRNKKTGDSGEELVIQNEKRILEDNELFDLSKKVEKVKDGRGFDILSYELSGKEKYIEVKTTSGISTRPFIMTDDEWEFMKRHSENYHLYRIYDYDSTDKTGKMFCLSGDLGERVFMRPKQFEIFLKTI